MTSFYCLKARKGEGLSKNHQIWAAYFMDGPFPNIIYGHDATLSIEIEFGIYDISYAMFYKKFNIFYINSIE